MTPVKAVKGTRDILPPDSAAWNRVEAIAREVFRTFNYQEIRTPIFEETALFVVVDEEHGLGPYFGIGGERGEQAVGQRIPARGRRFGLFGIFG